MGSGVCLLPILHPGPLGLSLSAHERRFAKLLLGLRAGIRRAKVSMPGGEMMEYAVLVNEDVYRLVGSVNAALEDGWEPQGGIMSVALSGPLGFAPGLMWAQAIVRHDVERGE